MFKFKIIEVDGAEYYFCIIDGSASIKRISYDKLSIKHMPFNLIDTYVHTTYCGYSFLEAKEKVLSDPKLQKYLLLL